MDGYSTIDEAVLERARNGDRQAHAELYRAYSAIVYTLAYRMLGSKAAAEDVLQDSFVQVIRKASDYRGDGDIGAWIKRIAINRALSHLRSPWIVRRSSASETQADAAVMQQDAMTVRADENIRGLARQQELERALAALTPMARAVVWLHDVEGYTHGEIGRLMGRSTSFSKSQLSRAYREMRDLLERTASSQTNDATDKGTDEGTEPCLGLLKTV